MTYVKFKNNGQLTDTMMNKMFNPVFNEFFNSNIQDSAHVRPAVNISETEEFFQIELAAPGLSKEAFDIKLEKEVLTISSVIKTEEVKDEKKYTRKEFAFHSFKRTFTLPEIADQENIKAEYKEGILYITISKKQEAVKAVKEIKIS